MTAKTKKISLVEKARRIYGNHNVGFLGSPLAGCKNDDAEIILHELCHMVFLDIKCSIGDMDWTHEEMVKRLDALDPLISDLHEIRTAAAELIVAKKLRLRIPEGIFFYIVGRNLKKEILKPYVEDLIHKAQKTEKVRFAAAQVYELFKMAKV